MKIVATRVNEHDEKEYTVVPTVEERNWMAVYSNMAGNLCECDMDIVDRFAARAWDYGFSKCGAFVRLLNAWLAKLDEVGAVSLRRMYGAVLTYDEAECVLAYRHMISRFNNDQVEALRHVFASVMQYDPERRGLMLDVLEQAEDLLAGGADFLTVRVG